MIKNTVLKYFLLKQTFLPSSAILKYKIKEALGDRKKPGFRKERKPGFFR